MLKVPTALRTKELGGINFGHEVRKAGFLAAAPAFLLGIGDSLGLAGTIHKHPGAKREPGLVELEADRATLTLTEDAKANNGLSLALRSPNGETTSQTLISDLRTNIDLEDWVYRVREMLNNDS